MYLRLLNSHDACGVDAHALIGFVNIPATSPGVTWL